MIGDLEHAIDVVLDQQHRNFRCDGREQRGNPRALGGGEPSERLVEQENARPVATARPISSSRCPPYDSEAASARSMPARPRKAISSAVSSLTSAIAAADVH